MLNVLPKKILAISVAAAAPTALESEIGASLPAPTSMGSFANRRLEICTKAPKCSKDIGPGRNQRLEFENLSTDSRPAKPESNPVQSALRKHVA
jgi:hypothetical protein